MHRFILASASPARLAALRAAGTRPEVIVSDVDEAEFAETDPAKLVEQLAIAKAISVAGTISEPALVLGCDSLLDIDGFALGKPGAAAAGVLPADRPGEETVSQDEMTAGPRATARRPPLFHLEAPVQKHRPSLRAGQERQQGAGFA